MLSAPEVDLSYENAKLTFDAIIAPELDEAAMTAEIDQLANAANRIAANGSDVDKLKAARQVIYEAGTWNGNRPFVYDHDDPYGQTLRNKLLATYLDTRRGNCVSMPILQLIVAERLGLNVSLSTAPLHLFMRYTNPTNGRSIAIESTSGGHPTRESEYFEQMGVTQAQVDSGIYLGVLTKRESIAVMASTVTEWLMSEGRYDDAIAVADVLLEYYPIDVHAMLTRGSAHGELLRTEFVERFPNPQTIPPSLRPRFQMLARRNVAAFQQAEAWGWTPIE
ncbi:transglutaminase family protein [Erythrobacter sp. MTPC3]|uniref:transglutaminase family protein n=1 Tax=Erythrobacter sp. MTPC3 TaxID=3056564 RepID=UPI0036F310D5